MTGNYWDSVLARRFSRRRALAVTSATAVGGVFLAACGGDDATDSPATGGQGTTGSGGTGSLSASVAKDYWTLPDETDSAVRGGIFRGFMLDEHAGHFDPMTIAPSLRPSADHIYEFLMARNRGPGIDPGSTDGTVPRPALAEAMEVSATV